MPMMEETLRQYTTRKDLAVKLGNALRGKPFHERTLIEWERDGKGPPATRIGREVVYFDPSVEKWMRDQEAKRGTAA
jgi:hypothetical protein